MKMRGDGFERLTFGELKNCIKGGFI